MTERPAPALDQQPKRGGGPAFAALDLGTNNCRLLVGSPSGQGFRVLDSFSRIVRLGEGLHHTGRLSPTAMERALAALHACAAKMARRPIRSVRAIATEACRKAANGSEFLARVRAETGLAFDIISTREEAELALDVAERLAPFEQIHCIAREIRGGGVRLLGTSGTVTTLAGVAMALPRYRRPLVDGAVLTREAACAAVASLRAMGREGLMEHPCVGIERVDFVLPGCAVFLAITRLWPAGHVTVADRGLREGMLLRMMRADRNRPVRHPARWHEARPPA